MPALVAFIASFCTMVIEIAAGRILAPYVGVSLYTWTSIIGVVLAGISFGALAGGMLADRYPARRLIAWTLFASGVMALVIAPAAAVLADDRGVLSRLSLADTLLGRVLLLATILFFLPSFLLGMVTPAAVKLSIRDLGHAGGTVGRISAISTIGSIAGTFASGFWLIAEFGTRTTLLGVGVLLMVTALAAGTLRRRTAAALLLLAALGGAIAIARPADLPPPRQAAIVEPGETGTLHEEESQYYAIRVERSVSEHDGRPMHALHLDHLVHSFYSPDDPDFLEYEYLRMFRAIVEDRVGRPGTAAPARILFIGGGGYTLPQSLARHYPNVAIDVIEIDPAVTRVAGHWFGLAEAPDVRTINEDARWFAIRNRETYDLIFIDAFNDLSVPYHLTTLEFAEMLARMLRPRGLVAVNVIDDFAKGRFLPSYVLTLNAGFRALPSSESAVLLVDESDMESSRSTFVAVIANGLLPESIAGGERPHDPVTGGPMWFPLHGEALQKWLASRRPLLLTDDRAPVDNLLAPLFAERYRDERE